MMTAICCTIYSENNSLCISNFFYVKRKLLIISFKALMSVIFEVTFDAPEADTIIFEVGESNSCFYISAIIRFPC